jgi:hypothetical protein
MAAPSSRVLLAFLTLLALRAFCATPDWRPINPEELTRKQSKIDPNADAEILFRDIRINERLTTNYLRYKIFTDHGREKYASVKIKYLSANQITNIAGRTIQPNGTIVELEKDSIYDKVEAKMGGFKEKVISFALPAVAPGSVIEYRWTEEIVEASKFIAIQTEIPADEVTLHVNPINTHYSGTVLKYLSFHCNPIQNPADKKFTTITVRDIPPYHEEPHSPPELSSKQWILVFYESLLLSGDYWGTIGKLQFAYSKERVKISSEVKQIAETVAKEGTDEQKLALLAEYCRKSITNLNSAQTPMEEREKVKANTTTADTFHRQKGSSRDIQLAFIALAQAAGYDARLALVADRRSFLFLPKIQSRAFVTNSAVAVSLNGKWKFYDINNADVPLGTLTWPEQGVWALIPDADAPKWVTTPILTAEETKMQRNAEMTLSRDGNLEGDVRQIFWGNESIAWRMLLANRSDAERQDLIRDGLKRKFADLDVTNLIINVSPEADRPVGINYHLAVKGYAQRTGKRLFIHPSFFTTGAGAYFTEPGRVNPVYFDFPWTEADTVTIHLPPGYELDHAESPASYNFAPVGTYVAKAFITPATNTLTFHRTFSFGLNKMIMFDANLYPQLKTLFDDIHTSDEHIITLKLSEPKPQ